MTQRDPYSARLILIRHGETVGNSTIRYYGRTDLKLSDLGRVQMRAASKALVEKFDVGSLDRVFTSPLQRARESAALIAGPDARLIEVPEFAEVDFGDFEGLTAGEIEERWPEEFARWNRDSVAADYTYPRGENRAAFRVRVETGLKRIEALLETGTSLIVAHRGVIRTITNRLASAQPEIPIGSIQILRKTPDGAWHAQIIDLVAA